MKVSCVEGLVAPGTLRPGTVVRNITDALLEGLTEAHREEAGKLTLKRAREPVRIRS